MAKGIMYVDNIRVEFDDEATIMDVCRKAGVEMPNFCFHSDLSVYGACRMCMVEDLDTGKIEITSQNHSYAVSGESLAGTGLTVTHINLLDGTVEGVKCERDRIFSVQHHPESAPGPQDSAYLFDRFIAMMKEAKENA